MRGTRGAAVPEGADGAGAVAGIVAALAFAWFFLVALLIVLRPRDVSLRQLLGVIPDVLRLVRDLLADGSSPVGVRLALLFLLAWLVSPIDLIPEFIPVIGPLDDVIVAILVLRFVRRRLGLADLRRRWRGSDPGFELLARVLGPDE